MNEEPYEIVIDEGSLEEMYKRLAVLRKREERLTRMIKSDALSRARFKTGDIVVIVTPEHKEYWGNKMVPETRKHGRVEAVTAAIDHWGHLGVTLVYEIAPPTKNGGFHGRTRMTVKSGDDKGTYLETYEGPIENSLGDNFWSFKPAKEDAA